MKFKNALYGLAVVSAPFSAAGTANAAANLTGSMAADNAFYAYIGTSATSLGTLVASGDSFFTPSAISSNLVYGVTNYLNIEVVNEFSGGIGGSAGPGGLGFTLNLTGPFQFANGSQTFSPTTASLSQITASYNDSATSGAVQPWVTATGASTIETSYAYGTLGGTVGTNWVDAATNGLNTPACQLYGCTVDFTIAIQATGPVPEPTTWAMMLVGFGMVGFALRRRIRTTVAYS